MDQESLIDAILRLAPKSSSRDTLIGDLIALGYSHHDIEKELYELIREGRISHAFSPVQESQFQTIERSPHNSFLPETVRAGRMWRYVFWVVVVLCVVGGGVYGGLRAYTMVPQRVVHNALVSFISSPVFSYALNAESLKLDSSHTITVRSSGIVRSSAQPLQLSTTHEIFLSSATTSQSFDVMRLNNQEWYIKTHRNDIPFVRDEWVAIPQGVNIADVFSPFHLDTTISRMPFAQGIPTGTEERFKELFSATSSIQTITQLPDETLKGVKTLVYRVGFSDEFTQMLIQACVGSRDGSFISRLQHESEWRVYISQDTKTISRLSILSPVSGTINIDFVFSGENFSLDRQPIPLSMLQKWIVDGVRQ